MNLRNSFSPLKAVPHHDSAGFSLLEFTVASSLAFLVLAAVASMTIYATRSEAAVANYADLDSKSRYALDVINREMRQAQVLTSFQTNTYLSFTNSRAAVGVSLAYNSTNRTLTMTKTGQAPMILLTECDTWTFNLYQRTLSLSPTAMDFIPATNNSGVLDPSYCKLVSLAWKCSRSILGQKVNTESVQAAQIVLRNKH